MYFLHQLLTSSCINKAVYTKKLRCTCTCMNLQKKNCRRFVSSVLVFSTSDRFQTTIPDTLFSNIHVKISKTTPDLHVQNTD